MSHQLTLSSLFSVLALASLCIAVSAGVVGNSAANHAPAPLISLQAGANADLQG